MDALQAPVVIALMGLPGSGKTTLAEALAPRIGARIVSRDAIRAAMFRPCSFTDDEKAAAFSGVLRALSVNCELGCATVVDGMPFSRAGELEAVSEAGAPHRCPTIPVFCSISIEEAQSRVRRQRREAGQVADGATGEVAADRQAPEAQADRDGELVAEVAQRFRALPSSTLELDATRPVDELAHAVLRRIDAVGRQARGLPGPPGRP